MEKKRILIIDDEPGFTRMVKLNLEKTGVVGDGLRPLEHHAARDSPPQRGLLITREIDAGYIAEL